MPDFVDSCNNVEVRDVPGNKAGMKDRLENVHTAFSQSTVKVTLFLRDVRTYPKVS